MESHNSLKILVVGDPSVGKTSLINILCQNEVKKSTSWTIGCYVDIKLYHYEKTNRNYYLEFIETNNRSKHPKSREMFYKDIKGIILVHDLSNNKSYKNLWKWIQEIMQSETFKSSENGFKSGNNELDLKIEVENPEIKLSVPLLVVGNKADLVSEHYRINKSDIANTFNGSSVCMTSTSLDVSSISYATNYNAFYNFYNQVIEQNDTMNVNIQRQYPSISSSTVNDLHLSVPNNKWRSKYNSNILTGSNNNTMGSYNAMQSSPILTNISPHLNSLSMNNNNYNSNY